MPKKKSRRKPPPRRAKSTGRPVTYLWIVECDDPSCLGTHVPLVPAP